MTTTPEVEIVIYYNNGDDRVYAAVGHPLIHDGILSFTTAARGWNHRIPLTSVREMLWRTLNPGEKVTA